MITKLDFSKPLLTAKDESVGITLGETLSNVLMSSPAKPPLSTKYFIWGLDLMKSGVVELDDVDKTSLIDLIDNSEQITVLVKGRLHEVIDNITLPTSSNPEVKTSPHPDCPKGFIWSDTANSCVPDGGKEEVIEE